MDLDLDNLAAVRVLGRGAMGTVFLVADRSPDRSPSAPPFFALKVVDRSSSPSAKPDADRRARWEVSLLARLSHPFLPSLLGRLETPDLLAWALPYCPGGDLNALRRAQTDGVFTPSAIRFYLSELLLALAHLHSLGVAYRDLKPENVLLQASGHLTLTDFDLSRALPVRDLPSPPAHPLPPRETAGGGGRRRLVRLLSLATPPTAAREDRALTKRRVNSARVSPANRRRPGLGGVERSNSFVGTEEYVAPEVILGSGHDFAVDWWGLGVVLYEMLYGRTPFRGQNRKETFYSILTKPPELVGETTPLRDLIGRLLEKEPRERIAGDAIKAHDFFRGLQWESLLDISRPPYIPPTAAPAPEQEEEEAAEEPIDVEKFVQEVFGTAATKEEGASAAAAPDGGKGGHWVDRLSNQHLRQPAEFLVF
uniref:non-specific serine/threonine protein kinase n=1 Tax=Anthurium amnicola TaxID=1678845 RepID=A0A1D1YLL2_9ARAE